MYRSYHRRPESTTTNATASGMLEVIGEASAAQEEGRQTRATVSPDSTNSFSNTSDKSPVRTRTGKHRTPWQTACRVDRRELKHQERATVPALPTPVRQRAFAAIRDLSRYLLRSSPGHGTLAFPTAKPTRLRAGPAAGRSPPRRLTHRSTPSSCASPAPSPAPASAPPAASPPGWGRSPGTASPGRGA